MCACEARKRDKSLISEMARVLLNEFANNIVLWAFALIANIL